MQVHDNEAVARGDNLPVSRKHAREVGAFIKHDSVEDARAKLERVINTEQAVPYKRYNSDRAHKKGDMDAGRYPVKTAEHVLKLLDSAEKNAVYEGLDEERLHVTGFTATKGNRFFTPKRERGRRPKRSHITLKVGER